MKRYFILAGVEHESKDGKYCIADEVCDVVAKDDGLWLITPKHEGQQDVVRLDADTQGTPLNLLWQRLYNQRINSDPATVPDFGNGPATEKWFDKP